MESKHTPGPWTAESSLSDGHLGLRVMAEDGREVARVPIEHHATTPDFDRDGIEEAPVRFPRHKYHTYTTEIEASTIRANAALIAAAPDMYEALEACASMLSEIADTEGTPWFNEGGTLATIKAAQAALAKAEGR